jgi:hypothetical protein
MHFSSQRVIPASNGYFFQNIILTEKKSAPWVVLLETLLLLRGFLKR